MGSTYRLRYVWVLTFIQYQPSYISIPLFQRHQEREHRLVLEWVSRTCHIYSTNSNLTWYKFGLLGVSAGICIKDV